MTIRVLIGVLANLFFLQSFCRTNSSIQIIPKPASLKSKTGSFALDVTSKIVVKDEGDKPSAAFLNDYLEKFYGLSLEVVQDLLGGAELNGINPDFYVKGKEIYLKEGYCGTCHQPNGEGLPDSGFPPLAKTDYVLGDEERLIKIVLKGLQGPMEVNGKKYEGQVPMTPFEGLLTDEEVAAVLSYVRNSFGNKADPVSPEKVKMVREKIKNKNGFYNTTEISSTGSR